MMRIPVLLILMLLPVACQTQQLALPVQAETDISTRSVGDAQAKSSYKVVFSIMEHGGMSRSIDGRRWTRLQVWSNGFVEGVYNYGHRSVDISHTLSPEVMDEIRSQLEADGLFQEGKRSQYLVPCASSITIRIDWDGLVGKAAWDEIMMANWGANIQPTKEYRDFVSSWNRTKITMVTQIIAEPRDSQPSQDVN